MLYVLPLVASAEFFGGKIKEFVVDFIAFINGTAAPLIIALAFLFFIWGVFRYFIFGGADEESREKGKSAMIWGIVGFVLIVSLWGLINVIASGLGFKDTTLENIPKVGGTR